MRKFFFTFTHYVFFALFAATQSLLTTIAIIIVVALVSMATSAATGETAFQHAAMAGAVVIVSWFEIPGYWILLWRSRPWAKN